MIVLGMGPGALAAGAPAMAASAASHALNADRGYYAMVDGRLEKWDFHSDGTFQYEGMTAEFGADAHGSERGTYWINGDKLMLKTGSASSTLPGGIRSSSLMGGSENAIQGTRELTIHLLGTDGADGVVINGVTFSIRHGW